MLMSPNFKQIAEVNGVISIPRRGMATSLDLPASLVNRIKYDVNIDDANSSIVFSEGDTVYILTNEFGLLGGKDNEVDTNILFVEGGLLIELISGRILLKGENGSIYTVDEFGEYDYPSEHALSKSYWRKHDEVYATASAIIQARYSLPTIEMAREYVDNFYINTQFHYVNENGYIFKCRHTDFYDDIALGRFNFLDYGSEEMQALMEDEDEIVDVDDDEEYEEDYSDEEFPMDGDGPNDFEKVF